MRSKSIRNCSIEGGIEFAHSGGGARLLLTQQSKIMGEKVPAGGEGRYLINGK